MHTLGFHIISARPASQRERKRYARRLTPAEITDLPDAAIDFSDVPELDEGFWARARLVAPDRTQSVTLWVKISVLDAFERQGRGYQTRMNAVLESYARTMPKSD